MSVSISYAGMESWPKKIIEVANKVTLSRQAMQRIGEAQRARNYERASLRGLDVNGRPFLPYSTKGPFYYYPSLAKSARKIKSFSFTPMEPIPGLREDLDIQVAGRRRNPRKEAAQRLVKKLRNAGAEDGQVTRGGGVKFASYASFKASLGRIGVDLSGPQNRAWRQVVTARPQGDPDASVAIGIYAEGAARMRGHQEGNPAKHLPQRRWLGATREEAAEIRADIERELDLAIRKKA